MATRRFIRVTVRVPVRYEVGPIDVPVPDGVDPSTMDNEELIEASREIWEDAAESALPDMGLRVDAYPRNHPLSGEVVTVYCDIDGYGVEIARRNVVEHDVGDER